MEKKNMEYKISSDKFVDTLKNLNINTWFDLGLYLDKIKENKNNYAEKGEDSYDNFTELIQNKAIAFLSFYFSVDGVTVEIKKYATIFKKLYETEIHYIGGTFYPESKELISDDINKFEISECNGFDDWPLYKDFFFNKIERGSELYNSLILDFWKEVLIISDKLAHYIEKNNIRLLYPVNVCSNPGNVSFCLATVLVSELMGIPVINNNHDFYWEGGNNKFLIKTKNLANGPRDFFFKNYDVGEFFSVIQNIYPWQSRSWINVQINRKQSNHLVNLQGHNPANICEIGTAVDINEYANISKRNKLDTLVQFEKVFSRNSKQLVAYSIDGVLNNELVDLEEPHPILIGNQTRVFNNFVDENIIFLQPTRIISRKRIEVGFRLIKKLFDDKKFMNKFNESPNLRLTIIVTGPIPPGQSKYFLKLLARFKELIDYFPVDKASRVHLGFMFSEFDKKYFKKKFKNPIGIPELYNVASLILLPSKTEGRGLPIIEATASGVPIFCRRYYPENVYSEVIGEHLPEENRLKVIEYDGKDITSAHIREILQRVFFSQKFIDEIEHNKIVVKERYSIESLSKNIEHIMHKLYLQLLDDNKNLKNIGENFEKYKLINEENKLLYNKLIDTDNRSFLQGYGKLAYMLFLKSLIDPSFFRVEEQWIKGRAMEFASNLILEDLKHHNISKQKLHNFYNSVDNLFNYNQGEYKMRHDHSFAYRHRNKKYFPYQDYTFQELTGLINMIHAEIIHPNYKREIDQSAHFFTNWNLALSQITSSDKIRLDDRRFLKERLEENVPIAYFPGKYVKYELELFVIQPFRERLGLSVADYLSDELLIENKDKLAPVYIFALEQELAGWTRLKDIKRYIVEGSDKDLFMLFKHKLLRLIPTNQYSIGINLKQLGEKALKKLIEIRDSNGFLITVRRNSALMTDILDIDKFHIGSISSELAANIMGIPIESGYIQFVPAGVRTTLSYPTPIQTSKNFSDVLNGDLFRYLSNEFGQTKLLQLIKEDAIKNGNTINFILKNLKKRTGKSKKLSSTHIAGIHYDGFPYNGSLAKLEMNNSNSYKFLIINSDTGPKTVPLLITDFEKETSNNVVLAWNGGYILNPELIGKLGLPENFIGSPLGLLIKSGKIISPPLFNKAALLFSKNGKASIRKVNSKGKFSLKIGHKIFKLDSTKRNLSNIRDIQNTEICFYDLLYDHEFFPAVDRIILRLSGNVIKDILKVTELTDIDLYPVGLSVSISKEVFPKNINIEDELDFVYEDFKNIIHAVEAGPHLLSNGQIAIDMAAEGWSSNNSIKTQAARMDFVDMRGPKIAVGVDDEGSLLVLTINGRIRESVGATHDDMAKILLKYNILDAMGFDPGGSSTLVVNHETLNISPYNKLYENNIFSLPPESRAVANAVLVYEENK